MSPVTPPELERLVEKSWLLSKEDCDESGHFEVLPDAHFGVGVVMTDNRCVVIAGGPITKKIFPFIGDEEIYWLRFRPGKMPRIADVNPRELVDEAGITLDRIPGVDIDELGERLSATKCVNTRLKFLGDFFKPMGSASLCQDRWCRQILETVDALDGQISVTGLSQELGMSIRMIQRLMINQVGLTPKQLILNVRLQRTIAKLKDRNCERRLGDLAMECGYADQSHLIRDFKRLAHRLPSSLVPAPA